MCMKLRSNGEQSLLLLIKHIYKMRYFVYWFFERLFDVTYK